MTPPTIITDLPPLPLRPEAMHKGDAGRVLIVAGSRGMSGAAALVALGALRSGAGLVRVACPASILSLVAGVEPSIMTLPLPETNDGTVARGAILALRASIAWADAVAIGPGLSTNQETQEFVIETLRLIECPTVVDADALNALADNPSAWKSLDGRVSRVLTPHPGEFARLQRAIGQPELASSDDQSRFDAAVLLAISAVTTVVLKGCRTVVADGTRAFVNATGNPGMATGGMGDVLTGMVAALLARGMAGFEAGSLAAYAHGESADELARDIGPFGFLAREVAGHLPQIWRRVDRPSMGFR